ncbi:site-specific integrase [Chromobacterium subtsugae]|uniref:site-specific integrase n=1 Tax=Chromobacterium subtsugae TaxID=251747 RepID=UPI0006415E02|nr:site-specific integrase [Chromobacterium subtsugae]
MRALPIIVDTPLPITRTRGGAIFDPNQEWWGIREGHLSASLNFARANEAITPTLLLGFKKTLLWYAENKSLKHVANMFNRTEHLFRHITTNGRELISELTSVDLLNYQSAQPDNKKWYLGALSGFLKKWHALGYHGVTPDAIKLLNELRLKGNKKGEAVLTLDPFNGPFTNIELEAIQGALNQAYLSNSIAKHDYLLTWLFMLLGQRPAQYALLKACDVLAPTVKDGSHLYILRVPRVKQHKAARIDFKERLITPQIGKLLYEYALEVIASFEGRLANPAQAPLFPQSGNRNQPVGMEYHQTSSYLSSKLTRTLAGLEVFSERTGDLIHITPTRFRRTTGTRAAQEGHGELVIAELLDHTDTQNVGVYVQATPEIVERIDRAVAMALAPLAQAFAGLIISDESEAARGDDPSSRIFDPRIDKECRPMGSCGSHGFCGFAAPIACYTCQSFQAWVDGPHEAVLNHLLAERERKQTTADKRIATINDRTILAVAEVIRQCEAHKAKVE